VKFQTPKRILNEDLKDAPSWVQNITGPFNSVGESLAQIFNKNVSEENMASQIYELVYRTPSTYPTVDPVYFTRTLRNKATGLQVLQCVEKTTYEPAAGPVYVPWADINGQIKINAITGLEASKTYIVRLRLT